MPSGRLLAIDLGARRVGLAVTDELQITVTPLERLERRSWKELLRRVNLAVAPTPVHDVLLKEMIVQ